jgi:hypothetical protein
MSLRFAPTDVMAEMVAHILMAYSADKDALDPLVARSSGRLVGDKLVAFLFTSLPEKDWPTAHRRAVMAATLDVLLNDWRGPAATRRAVLAEIARRGGVLRIHRQWQECQRVERRLAATPAVFPAIDWAAE